MPARRVAVIVGGLRKDAFSGRFAQALIACLEGDGDLNVDLHHLEFCDVSGIRALVSAAKDVPQGRRLVLTGLPLQLRNVMTLVGWNDLPGLVFHDADETG